MRKIRIKFHITIALTVYFSSMNFIAPKGTIDFNVVKQETRTFIKKAKDMSVSDGKYNVYAIKFTSDKKGYCMTLGYISGPIHVSDLNDFKYYFYLDSELVVVSYPHLMREKYTFINSCLRSLKDRSLISGRISTEPLLGTHCAYLCCYNSKDVKKTFYESDENVPTNKAIIQYQPDDGILIKIDSTSLKKILIEE